MWKRSAGSTTRCAGPRPGARAGRPARTPGRSSPPTASTTRTWSAGSASRSSWPTLEGALVRLPHGCAAATSAATPGRAAACVGTTSAPPSAISPRSAAATGLQSSPRTASGRRGDPPHADPRTIVGNRGRWPRRAGRGRRRRRQDGRHGGPLLPPRLRSGGLSRGGARLHLHRQGGDRAAPAHPRGARAAGRGGGVGEPGGGRKPTNRTGGRGGRGVVVRGPAAPRALEGVASRRTNRKAKSMPPSGGATAGGVPGAAGGGGGGDAYRHIAELLG